LAVQLQEKELAIVTRVKQERNFARLESYTESLGCQGTTEIPAHLLTASSSD